MSPACSIQRRFLERVPYNCTDCPWANRYPHLGPGFLQDQPNQPKCKILSRSVAVLLANPQSITIADWRLENNTYCDISYLGYDNRPLIDGNFDRKTFGTERNNINSTACLKGPKRLKSDDGDDAAATVAVPTATQKVRDLRRTIWIYDGSSYALC